MRAAGRINRRKNKVAIKRRSKRKAARFSPKQQAALHRAGKSISMSNENPELDQLREDITNQNHGTDVGFTPFCEAMDNAAMVALNLSEIFEEVFEGEAAQSMSDLSDYAVGVSEEIEGLDELDEADEAKVNDILEQVVKGLRFHEAMGAPSLLEACEFHVHKLEEGNGDFEDVDGIFEDDDDDTEISDEDLEDINADLDLDDDGDQGNADLDEV